MNCKPLIPIIVFLSAVAVSLPETVSTASGEKLDVFVSILPQKYFVESVGGDRVHVRALVEPGQSPATYEPSPRRMAALSEAKIYFRIGVAFENSIIPKISRSGLTVVDTREGIKLRQMEGSHHHHHGDHSHDDGTDPHIWLDPGLAAIQARTIADALITADPGNRETYEENLDRFKKELEQLDKELASILEPVKGRTLMVFHPAWGYFTDAYDLKQMAVELEGKEPSARHLSRVIKRAKEEGIKVIFVQPQFSRKSADTIAEAVDGSVIAIDPLAENYMDNLKPAAWAIRKALQKQGGPAGDNGGSSADDHR